MKILVINSGSVGEIIFSTVLIRVLKVQLNNTSIAFATSEKGKDLLIENPYIDHLLQTGSRNLAKNDFDVVLDLDHTLSSVLMTYRLKAKTYRLKKHHFILWLRTKLKIDKLKDVHLVDQYLQLAAKLGVKDDGLRLDYFIPYKDEVPRDWLPIEFQKRFVVVCVSVAYATRRLPVERLIELCDRINKPVILLGGNDDHEYGAEVASFFHRHESSGGFEEGLRELGKKTIVYNACGKFSTHQQASLIKQAQYVFTFDNDHLAIASAFGKETFSIWGNTIPGFGMYPYNTRFTLLENNRLGCRPCSSKGFSRCPLTHFKCMREIVFDFYLY